MSILKRLSLEHWALIHAKLSLVVWGVLYLSTKPMVIEHELGPVYGSVVALLAVFGGLIGIVGLILSTDQRLGRRHLGLSIELFGLSLAAFAPTTFFIAQIIELPFRLTLSPFAYTVAAFILVRIIIVQRSLKHGRY